MELRKDFLQNTQEQDQLIMLKAFLLSYRLLGPIFDEKAFMMCFQKSSVNTP